MLRERKTQQQGEYELVMLEELVPQDHFLRKVDAAVDFSFIHDMCKNLYCLDNGRPAIEPELLFKMLLLGYLYGIKSEIKLAQAVNENIAFKWFRGLKITEKGPDHATMSANRVRRFRDNKKPGLHIAAPIWYDSPFSFERQNYISRIHTAISPGARLAQAK